MFFDHLNKIRGIRPLATLVIKNFSVKNLKMAACILSIDGPHFEKWPPAF